MGRRRPLLGLAYLAVMALFVATCVGVYAKAMPWQRTETVDLVARQAGLELSPHADVKFQGTRVGEVRSLSSDGRGVRIRLAIDPDEIDSIPADVDAVIVPKTLFGEKFVDLRRAVGDDGTAAPSRTLAGGDTITQTSNAVELGEIFDRLVPVLRTLKPATLNVVLSGLAQALDGRGEAIAAALRDTDAYLTRLEPSYDGLVHDIAALAKTADVYADAGPDLLQTFDDSATIARENLLPHEGDLAALLASATETATRTDDVLRTNSENLIKLSGRSRPVLEVLDTYALTVPCILVALDAGNRMANMAAGVRGPVIGLSIDSIVDMPGYSYPDDLPSNPTSDANVNNLPAGVPNWKPHCAQMPQRVLDLPEVPAYSWLPYSQAVGPGHDTGSTSGSASGSTSGSSARTQDDARRALAQAIAAHGLNLADVPSYAGLLVEPLLSDGEVSVR